MANKYSLEVEDLDSLKTLVSEARPKNKEEDRARWRILDQIQKIQDGESLKPL